jgi:hypothetical protein
MAAGILAVRRGHFSSATQEAWGYPPSQQIIGEKSGLVLFKKPNSYKSRTKNVIYQQIFSDIRDFVLYTLSLALLRLHIPLHGRVPLFRNLME